MTNNSCRVVKQELDRETEGQRSGSCALIHLNPRFSHTAKDKTLFFLFFSYLPDALSFLELKKNIFLDSARFIWLLYGTCRALYGTCRAGNNFFRRGQFLLPIFFSAENCLF